MIGEKINIFLISSTHEKKIVEKNLIDINFVEDLVFNILDDEGVRPVCRTLFGLRVIDTEVWLAPNIPIRAFVDWSNKDCHESKPKLEIRMRFRPSCIRLVGQIDKTALDIIYAQIHHDFMKTRFNDDERDFVLLSESVLVLVAFNLVKHAIEHKINIDDILKRVRLRDFVPKRAARWQKALLAWLSNPMNLQKVLKIGFRKFDNDVSMIKRYFIEIFLTKVAPEYQNEVYKAYQLTQIDISQEPNPIRIRVRYNQSEENSRCVIETSPFETAPKKKSHRTCKDIESRDLWHEICDIDTINLATLSQQNRCDAQIVGLKGEPFLFRFETDHHAKSFLSAIDGYHRLMKNWNFNLCREVYSPELRHLETISCHGPIGCDASRRKLIENRIQGSYLIRRCMEESNRYLVDTLIMNRVLLNIDIDWNPLSKLYRKVDHTTNVKGLNLTVKTELDDYSRLESLIEGIEIIIEDFDAHPRSLHQLKYLITPKESDDCPILKLSMPKRILEARLQKSTAVDTKPAIDKLPPVIPKRLIKYLNHQFASAENGLTVELATFSDERKVVVKNLDSESSSINANRISFAFHYCPNGHKDLDLAQGLKPSQIRISDWIFVESSLFAQTIGYMVSGSIVQEYFPLGRLDTFLMDNSNKSPIARLSASLQLVQALMFLCDQRIIHGKIRCRNIMIKKAHPIQIRLTDPMGSLDAELDRAFIPPEHFSSSVQTCIKEFYTGMDVWAVGTTIWQIFNNGVPPPSGRYANMLFQTQDCPDKVWTIIEACWMIQPDLRAQPRVLYRDLFDLMAWQKGYHDYFYVRKVDSNKDHRQSLACTERSSNSDLSTLNTLDISSINSPTTTSSTGSQTDLLRQNHSNGCSSQQKNLITHGCSPSNPMSSYLPNWVNMINLKRGTKRSQPREHLQPHQRLEFNEIFGSSLSISNSTVSSTLEATRSTEIDLESISEAFDRCIWQIDSKRLKLGAEIGRGSSSVVIKGFMSQPDGQVQVVAVKCIEKGDLSRADLSRIEDLRREFNILKNLEHKNIIKTLGYDEETRMLVFEYMPLGSLQSCIRNLAFQENLSDLPLKKYALDIANGMQYLESMKIVHRDLALRNILMKSRNEVKICDFGLAQSLGASNHYQLETDRALPLKWYAPETLTSWIFTHMSDVWSYGVVLWEIYSCGNSPQYSGTYENLSETLKHERLGLPKGCPKLMYNLMLRCWKYEPQERISFKQICKILELIH